MGIIIYLWVEMHVWCSPYIRDLVWRDQCTNTNKYGLGWNGKQIYVLCVTFYGRVAAYRLFRYCHSLFCVRSRIAAKSGNPLSDINLFFSRNTGTSLRKEFESFGMIDKFAFFAEMVVNKLLLWHLISTKWDTPNSIAPILSVRNYPCDSR